MNGDPSRPRILVADSELNLPIQNFLLKHFPDYEIDTANNMEGVSEATKERSYSWLLIEEWLPYRGPTMDRYPHGLLAAQQYLDGANDARAIILTDAFSREVLPGHGGRLLVYPSRRLLHFPLLDDMIRAGDAGSVLHCPTIINLALRESKGKLSVTLHSFREGPLSDVLNEAFGFDDGTSSATFITACNVGATAQKFGKSVSESEFLKLSKSLNSDLKDRSKRSIPKILEKCVRTVMAFANSNDTSVQKLFRNMLHIHFHFSGHELLALPVDLARGTGEGLRFLCHRFPTVWRLGRRPDRVLDKSRAERNEVSYANFAAAYSCETGTREIKDVAEHAGGVVKLVGNEPDAGNLHHIQDRDGLMGLFQTARADASMYLITHGDGVVESDATDPDEIGPVTGPNPAGAYDRHGIYDLVARAAMEIGENYRRGFIFFNCCSLGRHEYDPTKFGSHFAGFAHGFVDNEFCDEIICNRFDVNRERAQDLANHFHKYRPRSANARAAALWFARQKVAVKGDRSWLAPMHLWIRDNKPF